MATHDHRYSEIVDDKTRTTCECGWQTAAQDDPVDAEREWRAHYDELTPAELRFDAHLPLAEAEPAAEPEPDADPLEPEPPLTDPPAEPDEPTPLEDDPEYDPTVDPVPSELPDPTIGLPTPGEQPEPEPGEIEPSAEPTPAEPATPGNPAALAAA